MLPLLRSIRVLGLYRIKAVWKNGRKAEVDLAPQILRYAIYRPLRGNLDAFKQAEVVDDGIAIAWPGTDLDISADAVAALHLSQTLMPGEIGRAHV